MKNGLVYLQKQVRCEVSSAAVNEESNVVCISNLVGEGKEAHRVARVGESFALTLQCGFDDGVERVSALELAKPMGYSRDRDFVKLVKRCEKKPGFGRVEARGAMSRGKNQHGETSAIVSVNVPFLTERQAVLAAMAADTDASWQVKLKIADIYMALKNLKHALPSADLGLLAARLTRAESESAELRAKLQLVDPLGSGVIGKDRAEQYLLAKLREASRIRCSIVGDHSQSTYRREFRDRENQLRLHSSFPQSLSQSWANLPITRFGEAIGKADEILARERRDEKRLQEDLKARLRQLDMFDRKKANDGDEAAR